MTTRTTQQPGPTVAELADIDLSLALDNKSPATRRVYGAAVSQFAAFLAERGMPSTGGPRRMSVRSMPTAVSLRVIGCEVLSEGGGLPHA